MRLIFVLVGLCLAMTSIGATGQARKKTNRAKPPAVMFSLGCFEQKESFIVGKKLPVPGADPFYRMIKVSNVTMLAIHPASVSPEKAYLLGLMVGGPELSSRTERARYIYREPFSKTPECQKSLSEILEAVQKVMPKHRVKWFW